MTNDKNSATNPQNPAEEAAEISRGEKVPGKPEHSDTTQPSEK